MTHYTVDYDGLTPQQAYDKALSDINDYRGEGWWQKTKQEFRNEYPAGLGLQPFRLVMSFAGIQGFPAYVFWQECFPAS